MFRRRRRRQRVQWLRAPGTQLSQNSVAALSILENPAAIEIAFGTLPGVPVSFDAPLVIDNPVSETFAGAGFAVWQAGGLNQSNEYGWSLKRIVGDIFIAVKSQNPQASNTPGCLVQAGIMVRRVNSAGDSPLPAPDLTVGSISNESDPWVWRRNWALSAQAVAANDAVKAINELPNDNISYGTKHHIAIDQKTRRRIGPEERLFLNVSVWELPLNQAGAGGGGNTDTDLTVYFLMPYRVLGTTFLAPGNKRNASR